MYTEFPPFVHRRVPHTFPCSILLTYTCHLRNYGSDLHAPRKLHGSFLPSRVRLRFPRGEMAIRPIYLISRRESELVFDSGALGGAVSTAFQNGEQSTCSQGCYTPSTPSKRQLGQNLRNGRDSTGSCLRVGLPERA